MKEYRKRIADDILARKLEGKGAVLIEGPKWCGKDGQECDAVVHLRNGQYGLIEIKLGGDKLIEEGAESLKAMESKIDTGKMKSPAFLMVLTGVGDYAYRRKDGVCVVPIGCLKD